MHIRKELAKVAKVYEALQSQPLSSDLAKEEHKLQAELSFWLSLEDMLRQKSREAWLHLGDKNSKIFIRWSR